MTAALVEVETEDLAGAARALATTAGEPLGAAVRELWGVLAGCAGMAGSDPGGTSWAAAYDRSARTAVDAAAAGVQGLDQLARMFAQTARNYEVADAASTPAARHRVAAAITSLPCVPDFWLAGCEPPSAAGGRGAGPPGWGLIEGAVGYVWPDGHQDRLRQAGHGWHRSARALREAAQVVIDAPLRAVGHQLSEADDMWTVCSAVAGRLRELGDVHDAIGSSCEELAGHIDDLHASVLGELRSLVEWSAGIEAAGGLLSIVTAGVAEVPAQAAEAARITRTATVVAGVISRFLDAARSLAASVGVLSERAGGLGARLRALLDVPLLEPVVVGVGPMRVLHEAKEVRAAARLANNGELPPLVVSGTQLEKKFKHAGAFGVSLGRGRDGFAEFEQAIRRFLAEDGTQRVWGTYRSRRVLLSFDAQSRVIVVQTPSGEFLSGWRMTEAQMQHVLTKGSLGGA